MPSPNTKKTPFHIALLASLLFIAITSIHLTYQGLYLDELHQATAAFPLPADQPAMFQALRINGIPVLNMTYSGAVKSNIYRLYLKFSGNGFSVLSWRLLGILCVTAGIFSFCILVGPSLTDIGLVSFLFFLFTDLTIILTSRHDWGPTALSLALRLGFIATWLRGELQPSASHKNTFIIGALVGFSIFEKLNAIVLVLPLLIILTFSPQRRTAKHFLNAFLGGVLGGMPLILANLYTYFNFGNLISLSGVSTGKTLSVWECFSEFIAMGNGNFVHQFILGTPCLIRNPIEGLGNVVIITLSVIICFSNWSKNKYFQLAFTMIASYLAVMVGNYLLPRQTWIYHWLTATPFHYLGVSLTLIGLLKAQQKTPKQLTFNLAKWSFMLFLVFFLATRLMGLINLEKDLIDKNTSIDWSPSLTQIGIFAADQPADTVFIAADWGVGPQIYCLSNGRPNHIYQLYSDYQGIKSIEKLIQVPTKNTLYIVTKKPLSNVNPTNTKRILRDIEGLEGWKEVEVDDSVKNLKAVALRKFIKNL